MNSGFIFLNHNPLKLVQLKLYCLALSLTFYRRGRWTEHGSPSRAQANHRSSGMKIHHSQLVITYSNRNLSWILILKLQLWLNFNSRRLPWKQWLREWNSDDSYMENQLVFVARQRRRGTAWLLIDPGAILNFKEILNLWLLPKLKWFIREHIYGAKD